MPSHHLDWCNQTSTLIFETLGELLDEGTKDAICCICIRVGGESLKWLRSIWDANIVQRRLTLFLTQTTCLTSNAFERQHCAGMWPRPFVHLNWHGATEVDGAVPVSAASGPLFDHITSSREKYCI